MSEPILREAIARGYHFLPTEEELIAILIDFLECKAQGKQFPSTPVAEKVLYGDNATPWKIFSQDDPWEFTESNDCGGNNGAKGVVYVLTKLSAKSTKKKVRTAGCGTWDGQTGIKDIKNRKGQTIGLMKMLSFKVTDDSETQPDKAQWRMHEYALAGVSLKEMKLKHIDIDDYVICKVTRDSTKCGGSTKDQILSKRKSEVAAESSTHQSKKFRTSMDLGAQELAHNTYPTTAEANFHPKWAAESNVWDSYPPSAAGSSVNYSYPPVVAAVNYSYQPPAAESEVNYSYPPLTEEATSEYCVLPPAAQVAEEELITTSNPEDLDIMWLNSNAEAAVNNSYPPSAAGSSVNYSYPPLAASVNDSYPPSVAESRVNDSYPPAATEASSEYCVLPPPVEVAEAELITTSNPEDLDMEWFNSLVDLDDTTYDIEFMRNMLLEDNYSYPPAPAEASSEYHVLPPAPAEANSEYCVLPPAEEVEEAELSTKSNPKDDMTKLFNSLVDLDPDDYWR